MALNYDSTTGNDYEEIYSAEDTVSGVIILGGIYNDGPESMMVKITVDDLFGHTNQQLEDTIPTNSLWKIDTLQDIGTAIPPYGNITIEVKSAGIDAPTDYRSRGLDIEN